MIDKFNQCLKRNGYSIKYRDEIKHSECTTCKREFDIDEFIYVHSERSRFCLKCVAKRVWKRGMVRKMIQYGVTLEFILEKVNE